MNERGRTAGATVAVVAGAAVVLILGTVRARFGDKAGVAPIEHRHAMTDMVLERVDGGTWRLSEHRGEVVAINLWATWCGPCREETPVIVKVVRDLGPKGFAAVGVSLDDGDRKAKVSAFAGRFAVNYPMVFPDTMSQMKAGLEGIPTTILLDRNGRVAKTYVGEVRQSVLRADVGVLLQEGVVGVDAGPSTALRFGRDDRR